MYVDFRGLNYFTRIQATSRFLGEYIWDLCTMSHLIVSEANLIKYTCFSI